MALHFTNSDLRQKVDRLMDELWAGGVNNPMTAIEQVSYLMFLKSLTERDEQQERLQKVMGHSYAPVFSGSCAVIAEVLQFEERIGSGLKGLMEKI